MTQAIATNIINNLSEVSAKDGGMDKTADFEKIFDKSMTIGDMKNSKLEEVQLLSDFKEILEQASSEVNVESSLDLTLARDITEIITELRSAVKDAEPEFEQKQDVDKEVEQEFEQKQDVDEETAAVVIPETTPFQQILSLTSPKETVEIAQKAPVEIIKPQEKTEESVEEVETRPDDGMMSELNIESVEVHAETSGDDGSSLMNNQSPQEQAVKLMIHNDVETFEVKLPNQPVQTAAKPVSVTPDKIIEQVAKQMESMQGSSKVNIVLNPESLGKVSVQLINTKEGLSAQFTVATQEARDLLMKGLDGLKETLTAHGVGVDNISVKISDTQKSEYDADWTEQEGSRGGNKEQGQSQKEEKEKGLFEKMMSQQAEKK